MRSVGRDGASTFAVYGVMAQHFGVAWLILLAVQAWLLHSWGGTLGKRLLNIRIVRTDGRRAGFARLFFLRACSTVVLALIPLLGPVIALVDMLMIFRASRRCLHDVIADTVVVRVLAEPAAA
jgi:uncharacterized RDD family membrane protein YckC